MAHVTELGYLGIGAKDLDAWKEFATNLFGMEYVAGDEDDRFFLRYDYWHHRIEVRRDDSDDLMFLGLRVAGPDEFGEMQHQLGDAGIPFQVGSEEEASARRVLELLSVVDPAGNRVEIFHGPQVDYARPFHPGRPMHGRFKTDAGGMGHCLVRQDDLKEAFRFYRALGMRGSIEYKVRTPGGVLTPYFMHCPAPNDRDHTIAFGLPTSRRIDHVMFEMERLDDVGLAYDLITRAGVPVPISLGKHSNDHMFSFYCRNPSGWMCEYGWGARPPTAQSEYYTSDSFGHVYDASVWSAAPETT